MPEIDCWITLGSTYTYLTVMRFPQIEQRSGVTVCFRPFNLRAIFDALGYFPFPPDSPKTACMWRDIERRAAMYGIPIRLPVSYPAKAVPLANKVALLGMQEGWGRGFIRAAYRRWFEEGQETGSEPNLSDSLRECGENPERVISIANGSEIDRLFAEKRRRPSPSVCLVLPRLLSAKRFSGETIASRMR
jgi:2-hydroxychromene-2-carboxylate isomerase